VKRDCVVDLDQPIDTHSDGGRGSYLLFCSAARPPPPLPQRLAYLNRSEPDTICDILHIARQRRQDAKLAPSGSNGFISNGFIAPNGAADDAVGFTAAPKHPNMPHPASYRQGVIGGPPRSLLVHSQATDR
jgi:hypothetical protein